MKFISENLFFALLIVAMSIQSGTTYAQSSNPDEEKIKADALAMAYVTCDFDLTRYYFLLDKKNNKLWQELQQTNLIKGRLSVDLEIKYSDDERLKLKYTRAIESAKKRLSKCIKYQSIMDSKAKTEQEDEKEKDTKNK